MGTPENTESRIIRKGTAAFMILGAAAIIFSWATLEKKKVEAIKTWEKTEISESEYRELELELESAGECREARTMTIRALKDKKITGSEANLILGETATCLEKNQEKRTAKEKAESIKNLQEIAEGKRDIKDPFTEGVKTFFKTLDEMNEELKKREDANQPQEP